MSAPPQGQPRPVILAHGSLRHADFRDRVAAVARAGFDGLGLHVREYSRLRSQGWSDAPGQGDFDLDGFLRALLATGTTAPVSVEVLSDHNDQLPPATVARTLATATRSVLLAAGASG